MGLCSGSTDFVFTVNAATGIAHAAKTKSSSSLSAAEIFAYQLAAPDVYVDPTWHSQDLESFGGQYENVTLAVIDPATAAGQRQELAETEFSQEAFHMLDWMARVSIEEAASHLTCSDMSAGQSPESFAAILSIYAGVDITTCAQLPASACRLTETSFIRAVCPRHCMCNFPFGSASFFSTESFGCPTQCIIEKPSWEANFYPFPIDCTDIPNEWFLPLPSSAATYGSIGNNSAPTNQYVFVGEAQNPFPRLWMPAYVQGYLEALFDYLYKQYGFVQAVILALPNLIHWSVLPDDKYEEAVAQIAGGNLTASLFIDGMLLPGIPHPYGYKGCEFLTSWQVKFLYSIDLCEPGYFLSIRPFCPEACYCGHGMAECPLSCNDEWEWPTSGGNTSNSSNA